MMQPPTNIPDFPTDVDNYFRGLPTIEFLARPASRSARRPHVGVSTCVKRQVGVTAAGTMLAVGHPTDSEYKQLSAGLTATLVAQLEERAAVDLVAARQRLERLIRAGSSLLNRSNDPGDGTGQGGTTPGGGLAPTGAY